MILTIEERRLVCPDCGCVASKKSEHASRCPRGSDPTGAKLDRMMREAEKRGTALRRSASKGGAR